MKGPGKARATGSFSSPALQLPALPSDIANVVAAALAEDIGPGDLTARLIGATTQATAHVLAREPATLCGCAWLDESFRQIDRAVAVTWRAHDSDRVAADTV